MVDNVVEVGFEVESWLVEEVYLVVGEEVDIVDVGIVVEKGVEVWIVFCEVVIKSFVGVFVVYERFW